MLFLPECIGGAQNYRALDMAMIIEGTGIPLLLKMREHAFFFIKSQCPPLSFQAPTIVGGAI